MILCFSHELTDEQQNDARRSLGVDEFVSMPEPLASSWEQVLPEPDVPDDTLALAIEFLQQTTSPGDYVLVQGEFGITCAVVGWCRSNGRIPVYSTTRRDYKYETCPDGTVRNTHTFRHVRFRCYFTSDGKPL